MSRAEHELLLELERGHAVLCEGLLKDERARYDALLAQYHALKAQGAAAPLPKREADGIMQTIADVAGSNAQLRAHLGRYAREQKAIGTEDADIISTLRHWPSDEDGVAD